MVAATESGRSASPERMPNRSSYIAVSDASPLPSRALEEAIVRPWRSSSVVRAGALLSTLLLGAAGAAWVGSGGLAHRRAFLRPRLARHPERSLEEDFIVQGHGEDRPFCGLMEDGVEYVGISQYAQVHNISSPGVCCTVCQADAKCRAWTWERRATSGATHVCSFKTMEPKQVPTKMPKEGEVVSGMPFRPNDFSSLFCFALMQPHGYEKELLAMQHKQRASLFSCDEYAVLSNQHLQVAPGVNTSLVKSDLKCKKGGEFMTALNTDIFMAVWTKVIEQGRFMYHDWTVKVDPDSVFFPNRLRVAVAFHPEPPEGVYLNNCKFGMHGPIEVFSRKAVMAWAKGSAVCMQHFEKLCSGPCLWGEDMFIDQCLEKVLKVSRVDDWNLLSEPHCDSTDWESCKNGGITFHPFKSVKGYLKCLAAADYGALPKH